MTAWTRLFAEHDPEWVRQGMARQKARRGKGRRAQEDWCSTALT